MRRATRRGLFIVLEGLDGAGTTTQGHELVRRLGAAGERAHYTAEPSSGPIGSDLRQALARRLVGYRGGEIDRRALALLFAADRLDHLQADIEPKLSAGTHVICDRYVLSSLAYQSMDAPRAWVEQLNRFAPAPDVTFFVRVRAEIALQRRIGRSPGRGEIFESLPQQRRIARSYERDAVRFRRSHRVVTIDGEQPIEVVSGELWAAVAAKLKRR